MRRVKELAGQAESAIRNLARLTQPQPAVVVEPEKAGFGIVQFLLGALVGAAVFMAGRLL